MQNDRSYAAISGRQYHLVYHLLALILCPDIYDLRQNKTNKHVLSESTMLTLDDSPRELTLYTFI